MFAWIKSTLLPNTVDQENQDIREVAAPSTDPATITQQVDKFELFRQWLEDNFDADEAARLMEAARMAWHFNEFFTKEGHFPHARRCLIEGAYLLPNAGQMSAWMHNNPTSNSRYSSWAEDMQKAYNFPTVATKQP